MSRIQIAEYREEVEHCPACGSALLREMPDWAKPTEEAEPPRLEYSPLVPVCTLESRLNISMVKSFLDGTGIRYFIENERTHSLFGNNPAFGLPVLTVEPSRAEEVEKLICELLKDAASEEYSN